MARHYLERNVKIQTKWSSLQKKANENLHHILTDSDKNTYTAVIERKIGLNETLMNSDLLKTFETFCTQWKMVIDVLFNDLTATSALKSSEIALQTWPKLPLPSTRTEANFWRSSLKPSTFWYSSRELIGISKENFPIERMNEQSMSLFSRKILRTRVGLFRQS